MAGRRESSPRAGRVSTSRNSSRDRRPIAFTVFGVAQPKGSKSYARGHMIEGRLGGKTKAERERNAANVQKRYDWFELVAIEALVASENGKKMLDGPLQVAAKFWFPRTSKTHKPGAWHTVPIDLDKALRAVGDSLKKGKAIREDSRIVSFDGSWKRYCLEGEEPRVEIEVIPLGDPI